MMKWYSVKKYTPTAQQIYLVAYTNAVGNQRHEVMSFLCGEWYCNDDLVLDEESLVTHFALIEPVEIEE